MSNHDKLSQLQTELERVSRQRTYYQEALRKSEELIKMIVDNAPIGITQFDQAGVVTSVNDRYLEIMGTTRTAIIGFNLLQDLSDRKMIEAINLAILGQVSKFEGVYKSVTGSKELPIRTIHYPAIDSAGNFVGGLGIIEDLSEQWEANAALRNSEERYRMIFENTPLGIGHYDANGTITHCNSQFAKIMGAPKAAIIGFNGKNITDPLMSKALSKALQGEIGTYEGNYLSITGQKRTPLRATFCGLFASDGKLLGGIGVFEDITERIQVEEDLRKSETYNNLILNGISEDLVLYEVIDENNFLFAKVNENFLHSFHLQEEQVIGKTIKQVIPADLAKKWSNNNRKVLRSKKPLITEDNYGSHGVFLVKLFPVQNQQGAINHIIVTSWNITEQKKMEEHQLKLQRLESVGLLAGGIAHDFNNILTAVLGNTSLARMKLNQMPDMPEKAKLLTWLQEIDRASNQAKDLTKQLLTFAKGGNPIFNTVEVEKMLRETADFAVRGSNVCLKYLLPTDLATVEIDEGQISQVIHNLILNAVQAMPEGGEISISAKNCTAGHNVLSHLKKGAYVAIAIQDQGQGIARENLSKIFDPYYTTKPMGSGLGLTTSYSVVKKHKGDITVESEIGKGSTFHIYLPASSKRVKSTGDGSEGNLTGRGKVLVMDDEQLIRQVLSQMLVELGYEPVCVKEGIEAIKNYTEAKAKGEPFDVILADLTIPGGLGGKDTVRLLLDIDPKVKAIVSSGYSNDPVLANYKKYGFLDVVAKPYSIKKLAEVLARVLQS